MNALYSTSHVFFVFDLCIALHSFNKIETGALRNLHPSQTPHETCFSMSDFVRNGGRWTKSTCNPEHRAITRCSVLEGGLVLFLVEVLSG
eukprot:4776262-Amphidinium_carterae.1